MMANAKHLKTGKSGEDIACQHLLKNGLTLIERNYKCFSGEIDLIMQDKEHVVFVEVRVRHRTDFGSALDSVTPSKMQKLIRTATYYLQKKKWLYTRNSRFDVV